MNSDLGEVTFIYDQAENTAQNGETRRIFMDTTGFVLVKRSLFNAESAAPQWN